MNKVYIFQPDMLNWCKKDIWLISRQLFTTRYESRLVLYK